MLMAVMGVRKVWMRMRQRFMPMRLTVLGSRRIWKIVQMLMMFVVDMLMLVIHHLMSMLVLVALV